MDPGMILNLGDTAVLGRHFDDLCWLFRRQNMKMTLNDCRFHLQSSTPVVTQQSANVFPECFDTVFGNLKMVIVPKHI
jgi:hypothetical protein